MHTSRKTPSATHLKALLSVVMGYQEHAAIVDQAVQWNTLLLEVVHKAVDGPACAKPVSI